MAAYNHRWTKIGPDHYRLGWVVDFKYRSSRLRFPRGYSRDTDLAGAVRFAKKWSLAAPEDGTASTSEKK